MSIGVTGRRATSRPEQVADAASQLSGLSESGLTEGVDPAELAEAGLYPNGWTEPDALSWPAHYLPDVQKYFAEAATRGDALLCWID